MINISRSIGIQAPIAKVLDFLGARGNSTQIWSTIPQVQQGPQSRMRDDTRYDWIYKRPGVRLDGWPDSTDHALIGRLVTRSQGGLNSNVTWTLKEEVRQTLVTLQIEFELPASLLGKLNEELVARASEHDVDTMLDNLKHRVEPHSGHIS